jgi:hypothetical protein
MEQLLPIICIHSYNIITTKKLLCVSKSAFVGVKDIWNEKLIYEYSNVNYFYFGYPVNLADVFADKKSQVTQTQVERNKYLPVVNIHNNESCCKYLPVVNIHNNESCCKYLSFHNYSVKKINEFCLVFNSSSMPDGNSLGSLDNALYEDCPFIRRTLLKLDEIQKGDDNTTEFIYLNFRDIINRFAIFESRNCGKWIFKISCSSTKEAKCFLEQTKKNSTKDYYERLVIDLYGVFPYYVSLQNNYELNEYEDRYVDESVDGKWYFYAEL